MGIPTSGVIDPYKYIIVAYVISVLNMVQIVYLVDWGLWILMMNDISPKNKIINKSNKNEYVV